MARGKKVVDMMCRLLSLEDLRQYAVHATKQWVHFSCLMYAVIRLGVC